MCTRSDGILLSNRNFLFATTQEWGKMDSRFRGNDNGNRNDSWAQELIPISIKRAVSNKRPQPEFDISQRLTSYYGQFSSQSDTKAARSFILITPSPL